MMWIILILVWIIPIIVSLIAGYYSMNKGESIGEFLTRTTLDDYLILLFVPIIGIIIMLIILYDTLWRKKIKQWRK